VDAGIVKYFESVLERTVITPETVPRQAKSQSIMAVAAAGLDRQTGGCDSVLLTSFVFLSPKSFFIEYL
jgi:preprotein translocase subunit Sec61beta